MFKAIVRFSIRKKLFVGLTTLFLFIGGIYAMLTLPIDAVPDITNNQVQIVTVSPTLAPQEVEQLITMPIEIAMSNIMNVEDIRSVSRFGLSVVTVVFKEDVPTLDARQLINEQIQTVSGEISPELGTPEMMPITTGLGEIYQYILKVAPGYEEKYDAMELRTIQDWMVKRQLSGIPGIVEINSFGGYLKQYEVAVDPDALFSLNITIGEVFEALSSNNQNTGGSYIEKARSAYYIRSEGMITRIKDIEQIVVANRNGIPVHISDVGTVRFGAPKRFGAMTMDGKGECVGGIAMMLKGANANVVTQELEKGAFPIAVVKDAVVPTINSNNPLIDQILATGLKQQVAQDLWIHTTARTWGDVLGTGSTIPVHVYTRSDACGAAETFAAWLGAKQEDLEGTAVFGDPGVTSVVQRDKVGIGFNNIAYAYDINSKKPYRHIAVIPLDLNGNGKIDPEEDFYATSTELNAAIAEGKYPSPPARNLFLVSNGKPMKPEVLAFLEFILTDGQQYAPEVGYIGLSSDILEEELFKLQE